MPTKPHERGLKGAMTENQKRLIQHFFVTCRVDEESKEILLNYKYKVSLPGFLLATGVSLGEALEIQDNNVSDRWVPKLSPMV